MIVYQPYTAISCCPPLKYSIHCMRSMMWEISPPWECCIFISMITMMGSLLYYTSNTLLTRRTLVFLFSETTTMPMMCQDTITTQRLCVCPGAAFVVVSPKQKANLILREEKVSLNKKTTIITWPRTWKSNHQGGLLCPEFFSPTATATATTTTSVSTKYHCTSRPTKIHKPKSPQNQNQNQ